jgi:hypothetical protein
MPPHSFFFRLVESSSWHVRPVSSSGFISARPLVKRSPRREEEDVARQQHQQQYQQQQQQQQQPVARRRTDATLCARQPRPPPATASTHLLFAAPQPAPPSRSCPTADRRLPTPFHRTRCTGRRRRRLWRSVTLAPAGRFSARAPHFAGGTRNASRMRPARQGHACVRTTTVPLPPPAPARRKPSPARRGQLQPSANRTPARRGRRAPGTP